ncbi:MAG: endo alpha-1,4 polygalactosaminidase [Rhodosalinus sp.]
MSAALAGGYGVQYWGEGYARDRLAASPHGLLILEMARVGAPWSATGREKFFDRADLEAIGQGGRRPVLAYLNLGELEPWRDYWTESGPPPGTGTLAENGEWLSSYWTDAWRSLVLARVERLLATGADGLFLDDVLHYYTHGTAPPVAPEMGAPVGATGHAAAMMELVLAVATRARAIRCDAIIVVNNGAFIGRDAGPAQAELFERYRDEIDGLLVEDAFGGADHPDLHAALREDFLAAGRPVLAVEFGPSAPAAVSRALALGYVPYVAPGLAFDRLAPPPDSVTR